MILRASSDNQKFEKKDLIIKMAEQLLKGHHSDLPSVNEIIKSLNIAKGTFYLYFNTKEEIYLEILRNHNMNLFDLLENSIDSSKSLKKMIENISRLLLDFAKRNPTVMMLSSISASILEANLEKKFALEYKTMILKRMTILVSRIASKFEMHPKKIKNNILTTYILWIALWQHNNPPDSIKELLSAPPLNELLIDLDKTFVETVVKLWKED